MEMAPPRRRPPPLAAELVEEILLRFPPGDPASLLRAALVCKPWCRIVSGEGFRRRFREFHRRPPVLGLLCNFRGEHFYSDQEDVLRFVPAANFPRGRARALLHRYRRAIDARHGRVLLRDMVWDGDDLLNDKFLVWDPLTGDERTLPFLPRRPDSWNWNAAVLCAAHASGACAHLDCHRGPFLVVVVDTKARDMFVHVFSSEAGAWSEQVVRRPNKPASWLWPSVLVGNSLYFMLSPGMSILKYNLGTLEISVIHLPHIPYKPDVLTVTEDGRLGFAAVHMSRLYLWARKDSPVGGVGWVPSRAIDLKRVLPVNDLQTSPAVVGFADGAGVVYVGTKFGVFSINLKSQRARKVYEGNHCSVLPYTSFCIPAVGAAEQPAQPRDRVQVHPVPGRM